MTKIAMPVSEREEKTENGIYCNFSSGGWSVTSRLLFKRSEGWGRVMIFNMDWSVALFSIAIYTLSLMSA